MSRLRLDEVVHRVREEVAGLLGPAGMGVWLAEVRLAWEELGPYLHFLRGGYTRNLVYRDARLEVLLNCWDTAAASPIHDHGGQRCWFSIQAGVLLLEDFPLLSGGRAPGPARLGPARVCGPVGPGHVDFRGPEDSIHRVRALEGPAVTLHVYAGPVERCLVFEPGRQRCAERRLRYHSLHGRPVRGAPGGTWDSGRLP